MNERIRELAKQAMIFSSENGGWRISTHVPSDFQEKFAELIVQECAELAQYYYQRNECVSGRNIKAHFGVE